MIRRLTKLRVRLWSATLLAVVAALSAPERRERVGRAPESDRLENAPEFLLVRTVPAGPQPVFVCPISNADKWDYGGGVATTQVWSNWQLPSGYSPSN